MQRDRRGTGRAATLAACASALLALAATPAAATHPEIACGRFALTEPVVLPREALGLRTISVRDDDVVLNGECVSERARVRRRAAGGVRLIATFSDCAGASFVKIRARTDAACSRMRGRLVARRPGFRTAFTATPATEHDCGGAGICAPHAFCEARPGTCSTEQGGACVSRPEACPDVFVPVCGCDGVTYGNDCERQAAGVSTLYDGACEVPGCSEDANCADGQWCSKRAEECDGLGVCTTPFGGFCGGRQDVPVCGCDGVTYENRCGALFATVNVAHEGECGCPEILCPSDTYPADPDQDGCIDECASPRCGKCPDQFFPIPGADGCPVACIGPPCETKCRDTTCTIVCTGVEPS
jgi:hypothetical protein